MYEILGIFVIIIAIIIGIYLLTDMKKEFLKEFEKSCIESIEKRDKEFEDNKKLNKEFGSWLSKL